MLSNLKPNIRTKDTTDNLLTKADIVRLMQHAQNVADSRKRQ